jgi:hypothetical protein
MNGPQKPVPVVIDEFHPKTGTTEGTEHRLLQQLVAFALQSWNFKKSMGARHRVRTRLSYRPARLHRLAELMPGNRFLGSINV